MTAPHEYYPTPGWCVDRLLERWQLTGYHWLEPCVGDGAIVRAVRAHRRYQGLYWSCVDPWPQDRVLDQTVQADARKLTKEFLQRFDGAVTNPPFSLAEEIIAHLWRGMRGRAPIIMLLRLNFLATIGRDGFFREVGLPDTFILPNRPSFRGRGTDSQEYAWMVWRAGEPVHRPIVDRLNLTPPKEIKAWKARQPAANVLTPSTGTGRESRT